MRSMGFTIVVVAGMFFLTGAARGQSALDRLEAQLAQPRAAAATQDANAAAKPYLGLVGDNGTGGVKVLSVKAGGPASEGGLAAGDLIVEVAGQAVASMDELATVLAQHRAGEKVEFQVARQGLSQRLTVTLGARPQSPAASSPPGAAGDTRGPLLDRVERLLENLTAPPAPAASPVETQPSTTAPPPPTPSANSPFDDPPTAKPAPEDPLAALSRQLEAILDRLDKIERRLQALEAKSQP